jgi:hypothetical protein
VGGTQPAPPESGVVATAAVAAAAVAAEVVWEPVEEAEMALVTVVEEVEPSNDACRHSKQEVHSPRAPPEQEPEKPTAMEAPDGIGTSALARRSVQVVAGPRVVRREAPGRWWAQQRAPKRVWRGQRHQARVGCDKGHRNHEWCKRKLGLHVWCGRGYRGRTWRKEGHRGHVWAAGGTGAARDTGEGVEVACGAGGGTRYGGAQGEPAGKGKRDKGG